MTSSWNHGRCAAYSQCPDSSKAEGSLGHEIDMATRSANPEIMSRIGAEGVKIYR
jgi:hypothetical protein